MLPVVCPEKHGPTKSPQPSAVVGCRGGPSRRGTAASRRSIRSSRLCAVAECAWASSVAVAERLQGARGPPPQPERAQQAALVLYREQPYEERPTSICLCEKTMELAENPSVQQSRPILRFSKIVVEPCQFVPAPTLLHDKFQG